MDVAPSSPLTIGLSARPMSDEVVSRPKPAPRALAGITLPAAVYAAVMPAPIATPNTGAQPNSHRASRATPIQAAPAAASANASVVHPGGDRRRIRGAA